ncbi:MAG: Ribosomal RNA large subunit methyltransferase K [Candidatus Anoxychlamydiales bacterium]|nr:Ribosomal RNA large subunit methyltransferase K [Candidatus Anoxychlamydiales bacterium]NGX52824.1 Ribosomal RNA large subunit methyltransferase K [Candidatus Anoxychlamydiales bacterium]
MHESSIFLPIIADGEDKSSIIKNRIRKNYRHIRKWAKRSYTNCFRIYDRDIKEYPLAIDFYNGRFSVHFFSYDRELNEPSAQLHEEIDQALCSIFGTTTDHIYWRTRVRRRKKEQYEKIDQQKDFFTVFEYGAKFKVNLKDYLDTGLFLDHRETRKWVSSIAKGKRVLNLFSYTCSFSVQAALAGASFTKSVDLSNTYLSWGRDNFILNSLPKENNEIIRADCMKFLDEKIDSLSLFDIIIIDPPTISRSKKMDQMFDIQIDYPYLISKSLKLLLANGIIFFSTNSRKFKLDESLLNSCSIEEITDKTIPLDFHNKKIHRCWKITL